MEADQVGPLFYSQINKKKQELFIKKYKPAFAVPGQSVTLSSWKGTPAAEKIKRVNSARPRPLKYVNLYDGILFWFLENPVKPTLIPKCLIIN
ncbi:hypothetical protein BpHYR1_048846 [Brachionus plicatilis]|uniref:Uncharacterized protein n=1 Tax=Brachionus plicatilis TaxID=10195 RepID=A0A3M7SUC7_BRAPC|nr:hypothetical protein BpHYR1_048846 [Brachionus plicatilis]